MISRRGLTGWVTIVTIVASGCALSVAVAGLVSGPGSVTAGTGVAGVLGAVTGVALLVGRPRGSVVTRFLQWVGVALLVWATGQVATVVLVLTDHRIGPAVGDLVSLAAAPLAVFGALTLPKRGVGWHPRARLGVDAAVLGVTSGLLAWRFGYDRLSTNGLPPVVVAIILLADVSVTCLALLWAVRDLDPALVLVAGGVVLYAAGHLQALRVSLDPGLPLPWAGPVLWCLAWPAVAVGLLHYEPVPARPTTRVGSADPDARVVVVTTTASLLLLAVGLVAIILNGSRSPDVVSLWLILVAVVVFGLREVFNAQQRFVLMRSLRDEATTDPLTGAANRRVLADLLAGVPADEDWCLLVVDLDGFKDFNDLFGHAAGDRLLRATAHRLSSVAPQGALVSRVGGDEFAVLAPGGRVAGLELGQRLVTAVRLSAGDVPGTARVPVTASVGVADVNGARRALAADSESGSGPADPLAALSAAGAAQRLARNHGHDRVELFDGPIAPMLRRRMSVEARLRTAVRRGQLDVHFQPIVDLRRNQLTGAEALARWHDDQLGTVGPGEFIHVAEESGLVHELGEFVLNRTFDEAVRAGLLVRDLRLSCNVSPLQLRVPGFYRVVEAALANHGLSTRHLVVEVTEAAVVEEAGQAVRTLYRLADAGVTIAIDDFGTGFSALGYLRRLPAHMLKIDKSLTGSLVDEPRAMAITRAVIELGATIGLSIVVEGIESPAVAELVTGMGAGYGQGSLFGEPAPADSLAGVCDQVRTAQYS